MISCHDRPSPGALRHPLPVGEGCSKALSHRERGWGEGRSWQKECQIKWSLTPFNLRGASLLEFALAILVIAVVAVFFAERLLYYQERNEQAQMRLAVRLLDAALRIQMAELLIAGAPDAAQQLQRNPFERVLLPNYAGERDAPLPPSLAAGQWYYDRTHRHAVYVVASGRYLINARPHRQIRYRVQVNVRPGTAQLVEGVRMMALDDYRWF